MKEFALSDALLPSVLHLENPARQPWAGTMMAICSAIGIPEHNHVPFAEWLQLVKAFYDPARNPAFKLLSFLDRSFTRLATGEAVLDTSVAQNMSRTLRDSREVSDEVMARYVDCWTRSESY